MKQLSFSSLLSLLAVFSFPSGASAALTMPDYCHMDYCYQITIDSKEYVDTNSNGTLYLLKETTVRTPDTTNYPERIDINRRQFFNHYGSYQVTEHGESFVFCSPTRPTILQKSNGGFDRYSGSVLAILNEPYGYNYTTYQEYLAACHNLVGPDYFTLSTYAMLIREGYNNSSFGDYEDINFTTNDIRSIMQ